MISVVLESDLSFVTLGNAAGKIRKTAYFRGLKVTNCAFFKSYIDHLYTWIYVLYYVTLLPFSTVHCKKCAHCSISALHFYQDPNKFVCFETLIGKWACLIKKMWRNRIFDTKLPHSSAHVGLAPRSFWWWTEGRGVDPMTSSSAMPNSFFLILVENTA